MKYIQALGLLLASSLIVSKVEASFPKCSDCDVFATGKDGTLWGWEDDSFCKLPSSCNVEAKTTTKKKTKKTTTSTKIITTTKPTTTVTIPTTDASSPVAATTAAATTAATTSSSTITCDGCNVTATGGDNSLWGWENEKSCIIDQVKCKIAAPQQTPSIQPINNQKTDAYGNIICNSCTVTATGGDGVSLWGWENEKSCIIDNAKCNPQQSNTQNAGLLYGKDGILICSTCEVARTESDTTLWNTENGQPCRVIGSRCRINSTKHPWCSGCIVTGTGEDGALYGWENESSCLINEQNCGLADSLGHPINKTNSTINNSSSAVGQKSNSVYVTLISLVAVLAAGIF